MASVGEGYKLIQRNRVKGANQRGKGRRIRTNERSAETDRSKGMRKQEHRRWRVGTCGELEVSRGNGRGQANRPRPHVSTRETRKMRKIGEGQSIQRGIQA